MSANIPSATTPDKSQEFSSIFLGAIEHTDPISYISVVSPINCPSISVQRLQGIQLSHCLASLFGFKESSLSQSGSTVLCVKASPQYCYILGVVPTGDMFDPGSTPQYPSRSNIGQGDTAVDPGNLQGYGTDINKIIFNNLRRPTDHVEGEHIIANDFGVLIGLFQQLAVLKGSELAQVQAYVMDDLVRIISHNFQHYTAAGEYKIYHDGKAIMVEYGATHIPNEIYGQPIRNQESDTSPFTKGLPSQSDDSQDFYGFSTNERVQAIERLKIYLGRLGDFINAFLAIPDITQIKDLDGTVPSTPDTGVFNLHLGTDGGLHIRSIKEIFIEKTNWIRIPQRIRDPDDPTGDDASNITYPIKQEFQFNNNYKLDQNPFLYYLQLRDYVAYTIQNTAFQNLQQHKKDFYLNDDYSNETPLDEIQIVDPQTPSANLANYSLRNSGFYLMPNGGFLIKDAWGSSIVSEGGNIYIQPAKDLIMQPMRNLIGKVGQFTSIASQMDIDLSSTSAGVRIKSDLAQYFYSDNSGIVFQANGNTPSTGSSDISGGNAIETIGGIVMKSTLGIYSYATTDILQYASNNLVLKSDSELQIQSQQNLILTSQDDVFIAAQSTLGLYSLSSAEFVAGGSMAIGGAAGTAFGQKDQFLGFDYIPNDPVVDPIKGSLNIESLVSPANQLVSTNVLSTIDSFQNKSQFQELTFRFLSTDKYGNLDETIDPIPQTIAQQENTAAGTDSLTPWQEVSVNDTYPYPGADLFDSFFVSSAGYNNVESAPDGNDFVESPDGTNTPTALTNVSLSQYNVYPPPT
jgi:hypothetical protein